MSTRSDIIVQMRNGQWARIYCHWDGYPEHNGQILYDHYSNIVKAERLIKLGDLSSLGPEIGRKHSFDWRNKIYAKYRDNGRGPVNKSKMENDPDYQRYNKMCLAYGRDRGEPDTDAKLFPTLSAAWPDTDTGTEFTYVFADLGNSRGRQWYVGDPDEGAQTLRDLGAVLRGEQAPPATAIKAFGVNFVIGHR